MQSGGYNPHFNEMQVSLGASGFAFATIGLLGVYDNKPAWMKIYNYFQWTKILCLCGEDDAETQNLRPLEVVVDLHPSRFVVVNAQEADGREREAAGAEGDLHFIEMRIVAPALH